jgi:PhnB protein
VRRAFAALADGGEVQMPLEPVFWSPLFGACVDRFGVSWMLSGEGEGQG